MQEILKKYLIENNYHYENVTDIYFKYKEKDNINISIKDYMTSVHGYKNKMNFHFSINTFKDENDLTKFINIIKEFELWILK